MKFNFCTQSQLTEQNLKSIVNLKKKHWDYSEEEHRRWIDNNINIEDFHVLMFQNETLVGYLNLINTEVILNNETHFFLGIGNVCSLEKGLGYGKELLVGMQKHLVQNNLKGILFCKDNLVDFYNKFGWKLVSKNKIVSENLKNVNVMLYNIDDDIECVDYKGRNF
ncbi:GNAT family N-acetyltransferase [Flavobacterium sp. YJ01]|uniref:GNAT family N-acetyltransferase n=1 Tax=unclassified Flavobacterium TaxID=196869 RepID=UPI0023E4152A|nr:GNAT family N-acetyltransferase [Flavobacterium sp. YJ01]WET01208.1 GNAT family N-acetyltransferase [Flavobacterium sp. YJ01]